MNTHIELPPVGRDAHLYLEQRRLQQERNNPVRIAELQEQIPLEIAAGNMQTATELLQELGILEKSSNPTVTGKEHADGTRGETIPKLAALS